MAEIVAVRIPKETVNDDRVLILEWTVSDGATVVMDQLLVEVESSKSTSEVTSPAVGVIKIVVASDTEARVGEVLCYIGESLAAIDAHLTSGTTVGAAVSGMSQSQSVVAQAQAPTVLSTVERRSDEIVGPKSTRLSRRALELLKSRGLSPASFPQRGLVRERDLLAEFAPPATPVKHVAPTLAASPQRVSLVSSTAGVSFRSEPQPRGKRIESKMLAWSVQQAIRSSVTIAVPTLGRDVLTTFHPDAASLLTASLIAECGQLLKEYSVFNACCLDEEFRFYEPVNIAYALDAGRGLKTPVFRSVDQMDATSVAATRQKFVAAYLADELSAESLSGATFTISDLSGGGVFLFDPLISEGQSGILGIGAEYASAPGQLAYNLILSFDHRIAEGRSATRFLNDLKERMASWERSLSSQQGVRSQSNAVSCSRCGMSPSEAAKHQHFLVSVAGQSLAAPNQFVCTICLQGR